MPAHASAPAPRALSWPALLAVLAWGTSFVAVRVALGSVEPLALVGSRMALGAALLTALLRLQGKAILPAARTRPRVVLLGLLLALHLTLQSVAMQHTTATRAGWIIAFIPVALALGGQVVLGQRLRARGWTGAGVALLGLGVLNARAPLDLSSARLGDLLMLVSCFTWTAYTLLAVRLVERSGVVRVTAFALWVGSLPTLGLALLTGPLAAPLRLEPVVSLVFLGLFCNGAALSLWTRAVRSDGAARAAAMLYLQPFVTLLTARVLLDEPAGWNALLGGPLVLAGVALMGRAAPLVTPSVPPAVTPAAPPRPPG